jgi:DNA-binding beta-propeller fold protein YncE
MDAHSGRALALAISLLPLIGSGATAQIAVSANDGKAVLINGVTSVAASPAPDYAAIIDLGANPPKIIGEVPAPASVVGPPQSVAVAPDESFALVTAAMKVDPNDPKKTVPDDKLTVIDLKSSPPKVLATLQVGRGPAGVSINRAGTLALVANRSEGTVSVFTIADRTLTPAGKIEFGNDKSQPSHAAFTPDGKMALVTRDGDHKISVLAVDGSKVEYTKRDMVGGIRPYSLEISSKGDIAVFGNQGGGTGDTDIIHVVDLKAKPPRIVDVIPVGQTPEGVGMSPDGAFVAVTVMNGSNKPKNSPFFNDFGLVKVFSVNGAKLTYVTEAKVGHWCQGAAWSKDSRALYVQCMVEQELAAFGFDGKTLTPRAPIKLKAGPAGIRTAER